MNVVAVRFDFFGFIRYDTYTCQTFFRRQVDMQTWTHSANQAVGPKPFSLSGEVKATTFYNHHLYVIVCVRVRNFVPNFVDSLVMPDSTSMRSLFSTFVDVNCPYERTIMPNISLYWWRRKCGSMSTPPCWQWLCLGHVTASRPLYFILILFNFIIL